MADSSGELPPEDSSTSVSTDESIGVEATLKSVSVAEAADNIKPDSSEVIKSAGDGPTETDTETTSKQTEDSEHKDPSAALDKLVDDDKSGWGWSSLSSWGTSVLTTAAASVNTLKTQVGEGFHQVMETVESGLLESDNDDIVSEQPNNASETGSNEETVTNQEMVRHASPNQELKSDAEDTSVDSPESAAVGGKEGWLTGWGFGGLPVLTDVVHKTSSIVQKTGTAVYQTVEKTTSVSKKVLSSGLDVLETIGKKTYDALAEDDDVLTVDATTVRRPTLSQQLREAKELAEARAKEEEAFAETRKSSFGAQFDDFQGLVQLEALEGLFSTSESKVRGFVEMLPKDSADPLKSDLMHIKQTFDAVEDNDDEDPAEHDFSQLLTDYNGKLSLNVTVLRMTECQAKIRQWLTDCENSLQKEATESKTLKEIHQVAIQSLAEMTAGITEHWRRVGQQLLILDSTSVSSLQNMAAELASITKVLCSEIMLQAGQFVNCLTVRSRQGGEESSTELITGVYLEASNASSYIRNGYRLLLPVLQLALIKAHPLFKETDS